MKNTFDEIIDLIKSTTINVERKDLSQMVNKLFEEGGELSAEVLIHQKAPGCEYKEAGNDGVIGECVDVIICALSIAFKVNATKEDLKTCFPKKIKKWNKVLK